MGMINLQEFEQEVKGKTFETTLASEKYAEQTYWKEAVHGSLKELFNTNRKEIVKIINKSKELCPQEFSEKTMEDLIERAFQIQMNNIFWDIYVDIQIQNQKEKLIVE